jgi:hypothetical protein
MTKQTKAVFLGKGMEAEKTLARLVKDNYGGSAVEYLVARLSSVVTESQLKVLIDYERGVNG